MSKIKTAISPTREENYPEWYQQVVKAADLAENSAVRGCMVIKPWGYGLWENIQRVLDGMFKATGHKNAYFPLFIPVSFLEKEAKHVDGFAKECAVVTHHRLEAGPDGTLIPAGKLEEPLVVRPTSETIIGATYAKWVQSYRDLPILINQWANVVRWEMRTRLFLRTTEFLWQEGHTVHATQDEAVEETLKMLDVYADFAQNYMAMPVIKGVKSDAEKFPGAVDTYCIEALMQDGKALQAGTSHYLGQNFSKASEIKFLNKEGVEQYAYTTSWGVSTRLIGGLIMTHSDDDGLILPPRLAPAHVVILPVLHKEETRQSVLAYCKKLKLELEACTYDRRAVEVELDERDIRGGEKTWHWVKRGIPIRLEVGPRDIAEDSVFMARRDKSSNEKQGIKRAELLENISSILEEMQTGLLKRALDFREKKTTVIKDQEAFYEFFKDDCAGFALAHFCGAVEVEKKLKEDLAVTVRCIPLEKQQSGNCIFTGSPEAKLVYFARSY